MAKQLMLSLSYLHEPFKLRSIAGLYASSPTVIMLVCHQGHWFWSLASESSRTRAGNCRIPHFHFENAKATYC